jgi:glycosyltransferase involved in cell wall biosynthesis
MMGAAIYLDLPFGISAHAKDILVNGQLIKSKVKNAEFINICNVNAWNFCKDAAKPLNSDNVHLRYHGISFDHIENFAPKVNEVPILLNNSRMTPKKGQIYLLQSAKILKEKNRKFLIRIISGGGNLYAELKQYILENDLSDVVDIVNDGKPIFYEEVEKYYKNSDIFVFPSIETTSGDADGVANVLIEAATYRLPIIATDAGSASELVENNRTGLVVPQKDPHALAKAIEFLLDNQLMGQDMAEKAFELVREKFDLSDNVQLIEKDILEHLQ